MALIRSFGGWLEAIEEERRARGNLAALEDGLNTVEEVRNYRAWRKALHRAKTEEPYDPAETARIREELARMITALQKTAEYERREKEQSGEEGDSREGEASSSSPHWGDERM
jgi:hypothetical protein